MHVRQWKSCRGKSSKLKEVREATPADSALTVTAYRKVGPKVGQGADGDCLSSDVQREDLSNHDPSYRSKADLHAASPESAQFFYLQRAAQLLQLHHQRESLPSSIGNICEDCRMGYIASMTHTRIWPARLSASLDEGQHCLRSNSLWMRFEIRGVGPALHSGCVSAWGSGHVPGRIRQR